MMMWKQHRCPTGKQQAGKQQFLVYIWAYPGPAVRGLSVTEREYTLEPKLSLDMWVCLPVDKVPVSSQIRKTQLITDDKSKPVVD